MHDLSNLTFIVPVKIESQDRYYNAKTVLSYLNSHFKTNVSLYEAYETTSQLDFLDSLTNLSIKYQGLKLQPGEPFHRTKYLNIMLNDCQTVVVTNYDIDVILPVSTYIEVCNHILEDKGDFVYPFGLGKFQKRLHYSKWFEANHKELLYYSMIKFLENYDLTWLDQEDTFLSSSESSDRNRLFAKTSTYKEAFGENEEFISYGPEDRERCFRFRKLGYRVEWWNNFVYHLEHSRTTDSNQNNPFFEKNETLYHWICALDENDLISYYKNKKNNKC
jgi:hypothetical protein